MPNSNVKEVQKSTKPYQCTEKVSNCSNTAANACIGIDDHWSPGTNPIRGMAIFRLGYRYTVIFQNKC